MTEDKIKLFSIASLLSACLPTSQHILNLLDCNRNHKIFLLDDPSYSYSIMLIRWDDDDEESKKKLFSSLLLQCSLVHVEVALTR